MVNSNIFSLVKLKLACDITREFKPRNETVIIDYPIEHHRIQLRDAAWIENLQREFETSTYKVSPAKIYSAPRPNGLIRHFVYLTLEDQLYYTLLVMDCFPAIYKSMQLTAYENADEAVKNYPLDIDWTKKVYRKNKSIIEKRTEILQGPFQYVVHTDITAFSPNIDQDLMFAELEEAGAPSHTLKKIRSALHSWNPLLSKGIPQILWATDVLSDFYINAIDNYMRNNNLAFIRESDNIEIYCLTESDARKQLMEVARQLFLRGLFLNGMKTFIRPVNDLLIHDMGDNSGVKMIKSSFKRLFNKLTRTYYFLEQKTGIAECYSRLVSNPENTFPLLQHYDNIKIDITDSLIKYLVSKEAIYPYQNYVILKWILEHNTKLHSDLIDVIRNIALNTNHDYYLLSAARQLLLRFGTEKDVDQLKTIYEQSNGEWEKIDLGFMLSKSNNNVPEKIFFK